MLTSRQAIYAYKKAVAEQHAQFVKTMQDFDFTYTSFENYAAKCLLLDEMQNNTFRQEHLAKQKYCRDENGAMVTGINIMQSLYDSKCYASATEIFLNKRDTVINSYLSKETCHKVLRELHPTIIDLIWTPFEASQSWNGLKEIQTLNQQLKEMQQQVVPVALPQFDLEALSRTQPTKCGVSTDLCERTNAPTKW